MIMRFMNDHDIDNANKRWGDHPVLGPASRTLRSLYHGANRCSDGWAYWPGPARAARQLMELIERDGTAEYVFDTERADATPAELRKAYAALRAFRTRHPSCEFRIYGAPEVMGDPDPEAPPREVEVAVMLAGDRQQAIAVRWPGGKVPDATSAVYTGKLVLRP
jgi:hypothetical protein